MSDVMLLGVLRMPVPDNPDPLTLKQFVDRARQAADRIESDAAEIERLTAEVGRLNALAGPGGKSLGELERINDDFIEENERLTALLDRVVTEVGRTISSELRADIDAALAGRPPALWAPPGLRAHDDDQSMNRCDKCCLRRKRKACMQTPCEKASEGLDSKHVHPSGRGVYFTVKP